MTAPDPRILALLVCPVTKASLTWRPEQNELWCRASRLAYPVREGVPMMLEESARALSDVELEQLR